MNPSGQTTLRVRVGMKTTRHGRPAFSCTNFRTNKKHSVGMASIDSSAPETTSSDNSPTVVRRSMWIRPGGPGSDSGSSGESSDSFSSSSSGDKALRNKPYEKLRVRRLNAVDQQNGCRLTLQTIR